MFRIELRLFQEPGELLSGKIHELVHLLLRSSVVFYAESVDSDFGNSQSEAPLQSLSQLVKTG